MPIPTINNATIESAKLRALSVWNGYDTKIARHLNPSCRQMFYTFGRSAIDALDKGSNANFSESSIRDLIRVCGITALHRTNDINYSGLTAWFNEPRTRQAISNIQVNSGEAEALQTYELLISLAGYLTINQTTRFTVLSSRILFYLLPHLKFFNINSDIGEKFHINHLNNTKELWLQINALVTEHAAQLNLLEKPDDFDGKTNRYTQLANTGNWWHRRVMDFVILDS
jgi:hypothetical protein